jgi:hypothetical protein
MSSQGQIPYKQADEINKDLFDLIIANNGTIYGDLIIEGLIKYFQICGSAATFKSVSWTIHVADPIKLGNSLIKDLGFQFLSGSQAKGEVFLFNPRGYPNHVRLMSKAPEDLAGYSPVTQMIEHGTTDAQLRKALKSMKIIITLDGVKYQDIPSLEDVTIVFRCTRHHVYDYEPFMKTPKFDCDACALLSMAFERS